MYIPSRPLVKTFGVLLFGEISSGILERSCTALILHSMITSFLGLCLNVQQILTLIAFNGPSLCLSFPVNSYRYTPGCRN